MNPVLSLDHVTVRYADGDDEVLALDDVSLDVAPGEFVAIMGPSGSGKSTLLNLAGGLESPTKGKVRVNGDDLTNASPAVRAEVLRRHVGYIFQRFNLVPTLTAVENVMLPLEFGGMRRRPARELALEKLATVGLAGAGIADRFPDNLSGGQQQRVAAARAIVGDRSLVLADEPTGALDTVSGDLIVELLAGLCASGTAVVLVTHEPRFASWADRVLFIHDGHLVDESRPAALDNDDSLAVLR